jgi:3D (Asp-Asp-Asp) domain-containing protein
MFTVALLLGLVVGFFLGRVSALAFGKDQADPENAPSQAAEVQPTQTIIPTPEVSFEPVEPVNLVYLGEFRVTAYCSCEICCGQWAENRPDGIVYGASGEELVAGVSCASPLPFGTVLEIERVGTYIVQDRTASWVVDKYGENIVDIYFDDHQAALEFGLQYRNVYMKEGADNDQM